ncbi:hypothetical protein LA6_003986 [Marinibacterium anthonyi]|nr:hypothetical protein LA6_003986 [Marinibacterium anthonyi]|tara:strand:- start:729 stop:839 length:111 start_codon:yes stop_codon:yes gene_type:complete
MSLLTASQLLTTDRMDWNKPHLSWISANFYRFFQKH